MNYVIAIIGILVVYALGVRWWHYLDYKSRKQKPNNPDKSTPTTQQWPRGSLSSIRVHHNRERQTESRRNDDDYLTNPLHPLNPINQIDTANCSSNSHHSSSDWSSSGSSYGGGSSSCDSGSSSYSD